jgi:hypothetical protein
MLIFALEEEPFEMHDDLGLESNLQNIQQKNLGRFNVKHDDEGIAPHHLLEMI